MLRPPQALRREAPEAQRLGHRESEAQLGRGQGEQERDQQRASGWTFRPEGFRKGLASAKDTPRCLSCSKAPKGLDDFQLEKETPSKKKETLREALLQR